MPTIELPLTLEQFHQLPRHPAYKYEYIDGRGYLTPRPRHYHALLDLQPLPAHAELQVRRLRAEDREPLVPLFAGAFRTTQPFGSLDDVTRQEAARSALERTWTGGDGPWIEQASFAALEGERPAGAILITLLPDEDPSAWDSYHWAEPPPADCIARGLGRPHLTWIFVAPLLAGQGRGQALLAAAANELLHLGYQQLLSTFMLGNDTSILWHWRQGFRLLPYPGSLRRHMTRQQEPKG